MIANREWRGQKERVNECGQDGKRLGGIGEGVKEWEGKRSGVMKISVRIRADV
jgi:hypothetical protein